MLKRITYSFVSKGAVALFNLLILVVSARYLGVRTRGDISIFLLNLALVQFFCEMLTGNNLMHYLKNYQAPKIIYGGLFFIFLVAFVAAAFIPFLPDQNYVSPLHYFVIAIVVLMHSFFCVLILAQNKLKTYNYIALLQPFFLFVFVIVQVRFLHGYTFIDYYYSLLASFACALPFSLSQVRPLFKSESVKPKHVFSKLLLNGFYLQSTAVMLFLMNRYNYYLLSENSKVGLYATACTITESLLLLANAAVPVLLSQLSEKNSSPKVVILLLKLILIVLIPALLLLLVIPEQVYTVVIGEAFVGIKNVMVLYSPAVVFQCLSILLAQFFTATGKQLELIKAYVPAFLITIFVAPLAIHNFGFAGAAIISSVCFFIVFVILYYKYCRTNNYKLVTLFKSEKLSDILQIIRSAN